MSYQSALEAAGAKVLVFESFGSYQGDWYAKVDYKGEEGWITGSFGSCSYCDSFESEFDYSYDDDDSDYEERLAKFGESYLGTILPHDEQVKILQADLDRNDSYSYYGDEVREILDFVKRN